MFSEALQYMSNLILSPCESSSSRDGSVPSSARKPGLKVVLEIRWVKNIQAKAYLGLKIQKFNKLFSIGSAKRDEMLVLDRHECSASPSSNTKTRLGSKPNLRLKFTHQAALNFWGLSEPNLSNAAFKMFAGTGPACFCFVAAPSTSLAGQQSTVTTLPYPD